jgi:hypothetical protein
MVGRNREKRQRNRRRDRRKIKESLHFSFALGAGVCLGGNPSQPQWMETRSDEKKMAECFICQRPAENVCPGCRKVPFCCQDHLDHHRPRGGQRCHPFLIKKAEGVGRYGDQDPILRPLNLICNSFYKEKENFCFKYTLCYSWRCKFLERRRCNSRSWDRLPTPVLKTKHSSLQQHPYWSCKFISRWIGCWEAILRLWVTTP